jgi:tetratricopeptide (TPR) repeat protein
MRIALDHGEPGLALGAAEEVIAAESWPLRARLYLDDLAVEVLIATGRLEVPGRLVEAALAAGADPQNPYLRRMRGRIHLAAGQREPAVRELEEAAELWAERGVRHEEARTRLVIADALAAGDDVGAAQAELRAALRSALQRGAVLEARLARQAQARLGSRTVTAEHVREALECMPRPAGLSQTRLARLLGLAPDAGGQLRRLLAEEIELMATSPTGREGEAGQLLFEYYLKRVGSQEVVAARLHLTRATFYRRLHLGWELLAERLTAAR